MHHTMKKRSEATQTLCSGAKIFAPPQTPFPGARDGQNLISWRWSLPLPTNPVWWRSMHAISSYRGNRPTNKQTNRADYNTLRRSFASVNKCPNVVLPAPSSNIIQPFAMPSVATWLFAHLSKHHPVLLNDCHPFDRCHRSHSLLIFPTGQFHGVSK